ncbi:MAG: HAMP domain-containing sensor histidine kinase [Syntrophomonadaceae bacterium]|nr:HAMP domain-containing sensor histidine kinase [Syntrophomonadaceae bacterium]
MKKLSIKLRVTLWITFLMLLLVGVVSIFMLLAGGYMVQTTTLRQLAEAVEHGIEAIYFDDDELAVNDELDFFNAGVYLAVYDENADLLYGGMPSGFDRNTSFAEGNIRVIKANGVTWHVFDSRINAGPYGDVWVRGVLPDTGANATFGMLFTLALSALPFLIILAAVGGYLITRRAFRPVQQINAAAERISEGRDLTQRINLGRGDDEIYRLAYTFDRMFDRLQDSFDKEKQFTANVSHELRTPTAAIIAQSEYALENAHTVEEAQAALEMVLQQAQTMSGIIAQLLTLARDDSRQQLNLETINLSELTEIVAQEQAELAAGKDIKIVTRITPNLLLNGDQTLLIRLLINLIANGISYGHPGGTVWVELYRSGDDIVGRVRDDGIGIAAEHIEKIWERFYQVDPVRSPVGSGAGLGLPMVRWIVHAHGGRVKVQSEPGRGSIFTFTLPAALN